MVGAADVVPREGSSWRRRGLAPYEVPPLGDAANVHGTVLHLANLRRLGRSYIPPRPFGERPRDVSGQPYRLPR